MIKFIEMRTYKLGLEIYIRRIDYPDRVDYCPRDICYSRDINKKLMHDLFCGTIYQVKQNVYSYLHDTIAENEIQDDKTMCDIMRIFVWLLSISHSNLDFVSAS